MTKQLGRAIKAIRVNTFRVEDPSAATYLESTGSGSVRAPRVGEPSGYIVWKNVRGKGQSSVELSRSRKSIKARRA